MKRLLRDTDIEERFTEHDLRGKVGSDIVSVERAADLLGHASKEITKRHYRRKPEVLSPSADSVLPANFKSTLRASPAQWHYV
jgi:integrase